MNTNLQTFARSVACRLAASAMLVIALVFPSLAELPYPIIFVHGIAGGFPGGDGGDMSTWQTAATEIQGYIQQDSEPLVYHVCLNHDGDNRLTWFEQDGNGGGDVVPVGWSTLDRRQPQDLGEYQNGRLFLLNLDDDEIQEIVNAQGQNINHGDHTHSNNAAIYKQGFAIRLMIQAVLDLTHADKVILIGHSMGGLAIREYLQRAENGTHIWWVNPDDRESGHQVAKVVTLGTPHLGYIFNMPWRAPGRDDNRPNLDGESMRDMEVEITDDHVAPFGVYLFGGRENEVEEGGYDNYNVNCNRNEQGEEDVTDNIVGLNSAEFLQQEWHADSPPDIGTFNPAMTLPTTGIEYVWMRFHEHENPSVDGDGVVAFAHQWLYNGETPMPEGHARVIVARGQHSSESRDLPSVMRGLDEPGDQSKCYSIAIDQPEELWMNGFVTYSTDDDPGQPDSDRYRFVSQRDGFAYISLNLASVQGLETWAIAILNHDDEVLTGMSMANHNEDGRAFCRVTSGETYFVYMVAAPTEDSWEHPYEFRVDTFEDEEDRSPNLHMTNQSISPDAVHFPGDWITITYNLRNDGGGDFARESWTRIRLSEDEQFDDDNDVDLLINNVHENTINNGQGHASSARYQLSQGLRSGQFYVLLRADITGNVNEQDEADNLVSIPIQIGARAPNLRCTELSATPNNGLTAGDPITLRYILQNQGNGDAGASRTAVYYSDDPVWQDNDPELFAVDHQVLAAGRPAGAVTQQRNLPNDAREGQRYIIFYADRNNNVRDESNEEDNIVSIPIQVERPGPDLAITNVRLTPENGLHFGQNFRVDYTLSNEGNRAVGRSHTGFVLSDNPTLSQNDYNFGNRLNEEAALDRGSSRNRYVDLTLPDGWENPDGNDEWFLIVHANRTPGENQDNIQNELTFENNPAGRAFTMNRQPGFVNIVGGVILAPNFIRAGREGEDNFSVAFTLLNVGEQALRFDWIRLVITKPDGGSFELFAAENQDFAPDQPSEFGVFDGWLDQVGRHRAIVEGQRGGQWVTFEVLGEGANPLFFDVHDQERANMEWNPQEIVFTNPVEVGESAQLPLNFINNGNSILMMSLDISEEGGAFEEFFSINRQALNVDANGGRGQVIITFTPDEVVNAAIANLIITTNDQEHREVTVRLSGMSQGEGVLDVDPDPIQFPVEAQTRVGQENYSVVTLRNQGNAYLNLDIPTIEGRDQDDFGFAREVGELGIPRGDWRQLTLAFHPTTYGEREAALVLRDAESHAVLKRVSILGTGYPVEGHPEIVIMPELLRYGQRDVGSETVHQIEFHNDGEQDLHINAPEFDGGHQGFELLNAADLVIEGGASDFISVEFTPEEAIEYSATIHIHSDAPFNEDKRIPISGYGEIARIPEIVISRNEIDFGQRYLSTFRDEVFVIENRGEIGSVLLINRFALEGNGADYFDVIEGNPPLDISRPGDGIFGNQITVRFRPEQVGAFTVTLSIHSNSPNSPHSITLLGDGIERVAGEDFVDRENVEKVDRIFNQWSMIKDIKIAGDLAFLAAGESGLQIVNISNPAQPRMVGFWDDNLGDATRLAIDGDVAYLLDDGIGLYTINLNNIQEPRFIAECHIAGNPRDLCIYGNLIYIGAQGTDDRGQRVGGEIQIIDVSDPANPNIIHEVDMGGRAAHGLSINGDNLFIASDNGFSVFGLRNPREPEWISNYEHQGGFHKVKIQGNNAYLLNRGEGLFIMNISDPANPQERSHFDTPGFAEDISVAGNTALIADMWGGLRVIDIANPDNPSELSAYRPGPSFISVLSNGEIAFAGANGLRALDISNPRELRETGFYFPAGNISKIGVLGNTAYVVDPGVPAIRIVDISDPERMQEVDQIQITGQVYNVAVQDNNLLVCGQGENWRGGRVAIYNLDQPDDPRFLGAYNDDGQQFGDISIFGSLCFASRFNNQICILNISDPNQPNLLSIYECPQDVRSLASSDEYLYIGGVRGRVFVINTTDPENLSLEGECNLDSDLRDLMVNGSLLYALKEDAMQIVDITNPAHPELISTFNILGANEGIALREEYAFVANGVSGIRIVDVSDPTQPVDVGHYNTPGFASGLSISGRTIYVADRTNLGSYRLNTPAQDIGVSPEELNYGEVLLGESSELRLFIANEGLEDLGINSIESDNEQFITNFNGRCVLSPDQQIELSVIFQPTETNVINQRLTISSDDPNEREVHIQLTGVGVTPRLNINPEIVDFDEVLVGELANQTMTLSNSGNADLILSDIFTEAPFSLVFNGEFTIEAGQSSEIVVTFTPEETGGFDGTLTISTNDIDNETVQIPLTGRGIVQNHAPYVANPLPDDRLELDEDDQQGRQIDLSHLFSDPDNDALDYSVVEVEGLSLVIDGSALVVTPLPNLNGEFQVTVGAEDMREEGEGRDRGAQRSLRSLRPASDTSPIRMMRSLSGIRAPQRDASVSYSFIVVVHSIPDRPEIINSPDEAVTVSEGDTVLIDLTAADADGDHLAWSIEQGGLPEEAELVDNGDGTAILQWATGYEDADEYAPLITVTDDSEPEPLSASVQIEIHVSNTNRAPFWREVPDVVEGAVGDTIRIQVTGDDPDGNAVSFSFQGELPQNATFTDNGNGTGAFEWMTQNVDPGEYSFTYLISDSILIVEASVLVILSPINHAPEWVSIPDTVYVVEGDSVAFEVEADDPDDDELTINYDRQNLPRSVRWIDNGNGTGNFGWRTDLLDAGEYLPIFTLSDDEVERTRTVTIIVANRNQSPVWREIPDTLLASEGDIIEFIVAGEDADGDVLAIEFHSDDMPDSARFEDHRDGTGYFYWMTSADDGGDYSASITLSDGELTAEHDIQFSIIEANRPPIMANMEDYSVEEDDTLRFDLSAEDPDGNGIAYFVENLPEGADLTEAAFSWTPDFNQAGRYAVTFVVTDDGDPQLSDEQTISITVENVNRPPVLAEIGDREISEDEELIFDLSADDPDGDEVSFSAGNMPAGSTLRSSRFRWTPDFDQAGEYDITFIATDAGDQNLTDEVTIRITVADVNRPPELIQPIGNRQFDEDCGWQAVVELNDHFIDPDGDQLSFEVEAADELGLQIDEEGVLSVSPDSNYNGSPEVTLIASDGVNEQRFLIVVPEGRFNHSQRSVRSLRQVDQSESATTSLQRSVDDHRWQGHHRDEAVSDQFMLTIVPVNDPPVILDGEGTPLEDDTVLDVEVSEGNPVELQLYASDVDLEHEGDSLQWEMSERGGLPAIEDELWRFIDDIGTQVSFTWRTVAGDGREEPYEPVFTVRDSAGAEDRIIVRIRVTEPATRHFLQDDPQTEDREGWIRTDVSHSLLISSITLDGEVVPTGWEVGVFAPGEIPSGGARWITDQQVGLAAWGDDAQTQGVVEGFHDGERIDFRVWDDQANQEYLSHAEFEEGPTEWTANAFSVLHLSTLTEKRLEVAFVQGWNLISININPPQEFWVREAGPDVRRMMAQLQPEGGQHHVQLMKDERGNFYVPRNNFNNIPFWDLTQGYQVKVDQEIAAEWVGIPIAPDTEVPISEGWNMIAYFPDYELSARSPQLYVISSIRDHVLIAKNAGGQFMAPRIPFSNMSPWRETQGYQINVDADVALIYPGQQEQVTTLGIEPKSNNQHWAAPRLTGSNMSVLIQSIDGRAIERCVEIAAMTRTGKIVGIGNEIDGKIGLAVWGDDPTTEDVDGLKESEAFSLRLWNSVKRVESNLSLAEVEAGDGLVYETDAFTIVELQIEKDIPTAFYLGDAYPNPFNSSVRVTYGLPETGSISLSVYDLSGRKIAVILEGERQAGHYSIIWNGESLVSGVYILRMQTSASVATQKVVLMR